MESIPEMKEMITEYLTEAFNKINRTFDRLVIIRDGIADTQFNTIGAQEISSIKEAISEVGGVGDVYVPFSIPNTAVER